MIPNCFYFSISKRWIVGEGKNKKKNRKPRKPITFIHNKVDVVTSIWVIGAPIRIQTYYFSDVSGKNNLMSTSDTTKQNGNLYNPLHSILFIIITIIIVVVAHKRTLGIKNMQYNYNLKNTDLCAE
jgi:hypothetical protein